MESEFAGRGLDLVPRWTSQQRIKGLDQPRFVLSVPAALALNLGHSGLAIRTTSPLDPGTRMRVRFRLPGSSRDIDAQVRVAWSVRRVDMGLQFEAVPADYQTAIDDFVDRHFFTSRKA